MEEQCKHHFILDSPHGTARISGKCKKCGEERSNHWYSYNRHLDDDNTLKGANVRHGIMDTYMFGCRCVSCCQAASSLREKRWARKRKVTNG